jgi:hypothetical protein
MPGRITRAELPQDKPWLEEKIEQLFQKLIK